jgi:hypothetical protein
VCCFIIEVTHGIYYNIKILRHHKDLAAIRESENVYKRFPAIIKEIKEQNRTAKFLLRPLTYFIRMMHPNLDINRSLIIRIYQK